MAQDAPSGGPAFAPEHADFDAMYQGEAAIEGTDLKFERVPWDIGEPQPALVEVERAGGFRGDVLDSGCGLGENSAFLAERGYHVTGVDGSASAIERARLLIKERGVDVEFVVADVTSLDGFESRFDTVLDSALYHCLGDEQRRSYSAAVHRATRPGARLHLFAFADEGPGTFPPPFQVSREDLRTNLGDHWNITRIERTRYASALRQADVERMAAAGSGLAAAGVVFEPGELETDEHGRITMPVWYLEAERR